ncbi:M1 family aminopeptidase [Flavobacterium sp.]|uniref:M1 family metallopeptidase n=1 Tax=Flavobacterium sp. TaxID=239 RepID=UPI003750121B
MKYLLLFFFSIVTFSQQTPNIDFKKVYGDLNINESERKVLGEINYEFNVNQDIDTIRIDAINMTFSNLKINNKAVNFKTSKKELKLYEGYKKGKNCVSFQYLATPKQTMYFTGTGSEKQIWTQGQGKYTSHWFPSFDDVNEKVIFNMNITYNSDYDVISNGILVKNIYNQLDNSKTWHYEMKKPMSSYLLMLAIGKFSHAKTLSNSGKILEMYYKNEDSDKFDFTYKHSNTIFDFLEKEIGVKYPWQVYRQIPVEDFLYAGMENTSSTVFSQDFVVGQSGFNDRNYINVNAHELAHQWFGDLVTAQSGKHHWLQEGFATYYALLAERKVFGDDYFYYSLYKNSMQLQKAAKQDTIPIMNEKASSLSFYQKGAWALHTIRESIGEKKFQKAVKTYLKKYKYKNVVTTNFLTEIAKVSDFDIVKFQKEWLEDYRFQTNQVNDLLTKNEFIKKLFEIQSYKNKSFSQKEKFFIEIMNSDFYYILKKEIINQIKETPFQEKQKIIQLAMLTNNIEIRQTVAETIENIPLEFKKEYETLLYDKSYDTNKTALIHLWNSFKEDQTRYLDISKNWIGNNDKELRITYLTLYLFKNDTNKLDLNYKTNYNELVSYTSDNYNSLVRQNAFQSIFLINSEDEEMLSNLINATIHHKWQFVKFAKDEIREFAKEDKYVVIFKKLLPNLTILEQNQINNLLK